MVLRGRYLNVERGHVQDITSRSAHKAAKTIPPAIAPRPPIQTPVGAAPALLELVLELPELPPAAPAVVPVFDEVDALVVVVCTFVAAVALPVMAPTPCFPLGV